MHNASSSVKFLTPHKANAKRRPPNIASPLVAMWAAAPGIGELDWVGAEVEVGPDAVVSAGRDVVG